MVEGCRKAFTKPPGPALSENAYIWLLRVIAEKVIKNGNNNYYHYYNNKNHIALCYTTAVSWPSVVPRGRLIMALKSRATSTGLHNFSGFGLEV